jgi:hypothetical protein
LRTQLVNGIPVWGVEEAASQFGDNALFVIALWHPTLWHPTKTAGIEAVTRQLRGLGCEGVISFVPLYWRYAAKYLPYSMWDLPSRAVEVSDRIRAASEVFGDHPDSQRRFLQQLRLRLHADFSCLEAPAEHEAYFPPLFRPATDESFVDCGANEGDTVRAFLKWTGGLFAKIVAFEPDPQNADALQAFASSPGLSGRIDIRRNAAVALEDVLAAQRTTFIKIDVEGAEMSALRGARRIIRRDRPILAVSVNHQQDHLWEVPLTIASELDRTRFALFGYFQEGMEAVCYAIPEERYVR